MILYHGTTLGAWLCIKKGIDVRINIENELDFGYGFYMGDKQYAQKVALKKAEPFMKNNVLDQNFAEKILRVDKNIPYEDAIREARDYVYKCPLIELNFTHVGDNYIAKVLAEKLTGIKHW